VSSAKPSEAARLEARAVTRRFAGLTALDGVSLGVDYGEVLGLIGPNGSGKTTLLNVISGVLQPSEGEVLLGDVRLRGGAPERAARLGVRRTFQNIRLFRDLTVLETVEVPLSHVSGDRGKAAMAVLEELDLAAYADRLPDTLPYGLQRRVELARAVAGEPRFLLLDEPTAGLTWAESLAVRKRYGFGVVIIDHDLRVITAACQRVVVLNEGTLIAEGTPDQVKQDPAVVTAYLG
jgi:ABC-type branched-subunit amino acid transport system ATPase component